ncbi:MAG: hypothetical protein KGI24_09245 [Candidatus Omnitrophica bacterium]|nr:hypothetical protein [Candidatus Omnitrophota bacterium]
MFFVVHQRIRNFLLMLGLRSIVSILISSLVFNPAISNAQQVSVVGLPKPGEMVDLSPAYVPVLIKGIRVHQNNPLVMDFIVDTGNSGLELGRAKDKQKISLESKKIIKYFLAALTLPEKDVWVNLSPYEKDRIIPHELSQTQMGRDMLAEDYMLKQITASLIYPKNGIGKDFWNEVYRQAYKRFGTTQVPVNTFNKVWIVADRAKVYENKDTAFVVDAHLKVMLQQDYLALTKSEAPLSQNKTHDLGSQVVREIILPALEKEVNTGKNFANLRQIFYSLILAKWYKQTLKQALLNQVYSDRNKLGGVGIKDKSVIRKIYAQYLEAYKKGVFNFVKEDIDQTTRQPMPRKYFSGGVLGTVKMTVTDRLQDRAQVAPVGEFLDVRERNSSVTDAAMRAFAPNPNGGLATYSPDNVKHLVLDESAKEAIEGARDITPMNSMQEFMSARAYLHDVSKSLPADDPQKEALSEAIAQTDAVKIKLVRPGVLRHGYALDKVNKIIYLDDVGREMVTDPKFFDFLTREIIQMVAGYKYAYLYAYNKYTSAINNRFAGSEPVGIIERNREGLLLPVDERGRRISSPGLEEIVHSIVPDRDLKIISPDENSYKIMEESNRIMEETYYETGVYALNGLIGTKKDITAFMNSMSRSIDVMNSFLIFFASKVNPITLAHINVTIAAVMREAVRYFAQEEKLEIMDLVNVSKEDPLRKPEVGKTYEPRLHFASYVINAIFGSMVRILPKDEDLAGFIDYLKHDPELSGFVSDEKVFDRHNGEENLHRLIRIFHSIGLKMFGYPVGGDHLRVFAKGRRGLVKSDQITSATRALAVYYPKINPRFYADLVIGQNESGGEKIFDDTDSPKQAALRKFYKDLLRAKSDEDILDIVEHAAYLPSLDTCGKLAIINSQYGGDIDLVIFHTVRGGEDTTDKFRDQLTAGTKVLGREIKGVPIIDVKGIAATMNATGIREALIKVVRDGVFDFNGFSSANLILLKFLFDPVNKEMLNVILRQKDKYGNDLILPKSIQRAWPPVLATGLRESKEHLQDITTKLQHIWGDDKVDVQETEAKAGAVQKTKDGLVETEVPATQLTVTVQTGTKSREVIELTYYVTNGFGKDGADENKITFFHRPLPASGPVRESLDIMMNAETSFNDAVVDRAMAVPQRAIPVDHAAAAVPGGIDFNTNRMQLDVQKQGPGIGINFEPELIRKFLTGDFQGFMPVIINISPIADIDSVLGLGQQAAGLNKV